GAIQLNYFNVYDMAFSEAKNSFYVASYDNWQSGGNTENRYVITRYHAGNYSRLSRFEPSLTALNEGGELVLAYNMVRYLFVNGDGSRLYGIRRLAPGFGAENWSIEEFDIL
ncbi:MAG: hypothetical protein KBB66_12290, partial [Prolixibacteraceae bacterium]|nr:hypothetical protein [Prolixibacteraceae bacterium]